MLVLTGGCKPQFWKERSYGLETGALSSLGVTLTSYRITVGLSLQFSVFRLGQTNGLTELSCIKVHHPPKRKKICNYRYKDKTRLTLKVNRQNESSCGLDRPKLDLGLTRTHNIYLLFLQPMMMKEGLLHND